MARTAYQVWILVVAISALLLCPPASCLGSHYYGCSWDTCGEFEFRYPFGKINSGCGDPQFQVRCDQNRYPVLDISGDEYLILKPSFFANGVEKITIINYNLWRTMRWDKCNPSGNYSHFWWSASHFQIAHGYSNLTLWRHCNESISNALEGFQMWRLCGDDWYFNSNPESGRRFCQTSLQLPISNDFSIKQDENLSTPLSLGFDVKWYVDTKRDRSCGACLDSNGSCGYNISESSSAFLCYCPDGTLHPEICPAIGIGWKNKSAIVIGSSFGGVVLAALAVLFFVKRRRAPPGPWYSKQCESIPELRTVLCENDSEMETNKGKA